MTYDVAGLAERNMSPDVHPVQFLFRAPPPWPSTQGLSSAVGNTAFQKYSSSLQKQSSGRTPLLAGVLDALEGPSRALHEDLREMKGKDDSSQYEHRTYHAWPEG